MSTLRPFLWTLAITLATLTTLYLSAFSGAASFAASALIIGSLVMVTARNRQATTETEVKA